MQQPMPLGTNRQSSPVKRLRQRVIWQEPAGEEGKKEIYQLSNIQTPVLFSRDGWYQRIAYSII